MVFYLITIAALTILIIQSQMSKKQAERAIKEIEEIVLDLQLCVDDVDWAGLQAQNDFVGQEMLEHEDEWSDSELHGEGFEG